MTTRSKAILAAHRVLLRIAGTRFAPVWAFAYRAAAWVWAAYLVRGEHGATAYVRGSLGSEDALPGLSDVDVAIVLRGDPGRPGRAAARARDRWGRLRRAFRLTDLLLDYPLIFERDELKETVDSSILTFRLNSGTEGRAAYFGEGSSEDRLRVLERPGLYAATDDWRLLRGSDRRPAERARDAQSRRIAAWLELCYWWQWVFPACADPSGPRTSSLCVKLIAEPARIWLWLAHGERTAGRADTLTRALEQLPDEERGVRCALDLLGALPQSPDPPLAEVLPVLLRLSSRIARLITSEIAAEGTTQVRLAGADPAELILPHGQWRTTPTLAGGSEPEVLPMCDWRTLTCPLPVDECIAPLTDDPGNPTVLAEATITQDYGPYPALQADELMLLPASRPRTPLRAVKCAATDPVSFALLEDRFEAAFPNVAGWSARDTAARGVAEHRAWLASAPRRGIADSEGAELAMLLSAARVAIFAESLERGGIPELPVTVTETVRQLAMRSTAARTVAEQGLDSYRQFAVHRTPPAAGALAAVRELVSQLPAYRELCFPAAGTA